MTLQKRIIDEVLKIDSPEGWHWGVATTIVGLTDSRTGLPMRHIHTFPPDVFENRAAEYGLDPNRDFDTILDIVLHELRIPNPQDPRNHENDAAAAQGLMSPAEEPQGAYVAQGDMVPTHLYNAETVEKALEAMLFRVEKVKTEVQVVVSPQVSLTRGIAKPEDPLDVLRTETFIDDDRLQQKRALVESMRQVKLAGISERRSMKAMNSSAPRAASKPLAIDLRPLPRAERPKTERES